MTAPASPPIPPAGTGPVGAAGGPLAVAGGGGAAAIATTLVTKVPPAYAVLARPVVVSGSVAAAAGSAGTPPGMLRLRTRAGEITVRDPGGVPTRGTVLIALAPGRPPTQATLYRPEALQARPGSVATEMPAGATAASAPGTPIAATLGAGAGALGDHLGADAGFLATALASAAPVGGGGAAATISRDWPTLRTVLEVLAGIDPPLARHLHATLVPRAGSTLVAAVLFFLAAARRGDARGWLGAEAVGALARAGRADLLTRLDDEFRTLARPAAGAPERQPVPFLDGEVLTVIDLVYRRDDREPDHGSDPAVQPTTHRFELALELSRLGPLRLAGALTGRRLALVLDSMRPLPAALVRSLEADVPQMMAAAGLEGTLTIGASGPGGRRATDRDDGLGVAPWTPLSGGQGG